MRSACVLCVAAALATTHAHQSIAQDDLAVAYVVQTITLRAAISRVDPGHKPVRVSPTAPFTAITRIEVPAGTAVTLTDGQVEELAYRIADTSELPRVATVQVDWDAGIASRCLYRDLIHRVRALLPSHVRLAMTALASWCTDDDWISDLPVDDVVPMLRSGTDWKAAAQRVRAGGPTPEGPCRGALTGGGRRP
jgi:hypothetical protein